MGVLAVITLVLWTLVAFGGSSPAVAVSFAIASLIVASSTAPRVRGQLDRALGLLAACVLVQVLPVPSIARALLSPHADEIRSALALAPPSSSWLALSIDPGATAFASIGFIGTLALFVGARELLSTGGVRRMTRAIAWMGLASSALGLAHAATGSRDIYWLFPAGTGAAPYGPFVNRHHFGTWVIMAAPLCAGYMAARRFSKQQRHAERGGRPPRVDAKDLWLGASVAAMLLALALSRSRSAMVGLAVSALAALTFFRSRIAPRSARGLAASVVVASAIVIGWTDLPAVRGRIHDSQGPTVERLEVWTETLPVIRDFWSTGVGAGAYETAMRVYQRSDRTLYFNQAQNHYLQIASEGGLLLLIPCGVALVAFVRTARRQTDADRSPTWWIRVGAACGLAAAAIQSLSETGLVLPANSALAAVLAAIVVHRRSSEAA